MSDALIDALLRTAGHGDDPAATRLLLARTPGVRLPREWIVHTAGAGREEILDFYQHLGEDEATRFATRARNPEVLAWVGEAEQREPLLRHIIANPHLSVEGASRILARHGRRLRIRNTVMRYRTEREQIQLLAAHPHLWAGRPPALGRLIAGFSHGADEAISALLRTAGPAFAADALHATIAHPDKTWIRWKTVQAVVSALPNYDRELDELIGGHHPTRHGCLALGTSTLTHPRTTEPLWADITWPAARAAALRALACLDPKAAPPVTAMLDGVAPQRHARIIEARAEFTASPLTASDVSTLAEHGYCVAVEPFTHVPCDRDGLAEALARWPEQAQAQQLVSASWDGLGAAERVGLFNDPATRALAATVAGRVSMSGACTVELLQAGLDGDTLVQALAARHGHLYVPTLWFSADWDPAQIAALPSVVLSSAYTEIAGPTWAHVLAARAEEATAEELGNTLAAGGHTEASANEVTARLACASPETVAVAIHRMMTVISNWPNRDLRTVLTRLDCDEPALRQALVETVVPRVLNGEVRIAVTPLVHRLPLEWARALSLPVTRRGLLDFISERFAADTEALRTFLSMLPTWTGTLQELAELTAAVLS